MKKKVFFIISSLSAGGSERVFWLLSQNLNKSEYDVYIVLLDSTRSFFSPDIEGVKVIDLGTIRASKSFFKLYTLLRREKPYAIFSTGGQINMLVGFVSMFINIPRLIARPTSVAERKNFNDKRSLWGSLGKRFYNRFDTVICQSEEIKSSVGTSLNLKPERLVVIPNPVIPSLKVKASAISTPNTKRLIAVGRLVRLKGLERLIDVVNDLPADYTLTIAGDGPLKSELQDRINKLNLKNRICILGFVKNVPDLIAEHDLLVLPSFVEGFPNVVIEALSVGTPVVAFKVGGISQVIKDGFNGYATPQNNLRAFSDNITTACNRYWDPIAIKDDVTSRFGIEKIVSRYESLI